MQHGQTVTRRIVTTLLLALTLGVRVASAGSISIQWDPSAEPEVMGYRVYIGTQPGVYSSSVDVGDTTTYLFNSALDGEKYCFAVAAYTAGPRLGDKSVEVCSDASGNKPPSLTNPGNQSHTLGATVALTLNASDPEGSPMTFSATGLPTGLVLNQNTGFISGTATAAGSFNTHVTVSDGSLSMTQALSWTVSAAAPGAVTPLRPSGSLATATPKFEWESLATATAYRLWVDDSSNTDPKIQLDLTPAQAGCTTAGAVCQVSPGVGMQAGRGSWSVRASNGSGVGPWSGAMDFTVPDTKAPTVTIVAPTTASTTTASVATLALAGTATDDAGVSAVTWTNNLGGSGTATGTATWTVAGVPLKAGTNIITVTARDIGGNIATDILTVTKADEQGPALTIASPSAATSTPSATLAVSGTASDDGGVTQVTWVNDRGGNGAAAGTSAWTVASVALKPGANVITVTATDAAGHKTSKSVTATMTDGDAPTVSITTPTAAATHSTGTDALALGGTAADAFGVTQVTWSSDRGGSGTAAGTTAWSVPAVALKSGANVITVTARDAAGNTKSDSITVTMTDGTAPVVAIAAPTAAATYTTAAATIALGGTASDAFGVSQVTWVNDKGGSGVAAGTTAWSVASVALEMGVNVITVTAKDAAGQTGARTIAVTRTDGVVPTVAITTPVVGSTFSTTNTTMALAGTASDNVGVAQVSWSNSKGGNGVASGTTAWTVASVSLQPGSNVITVTAKDTAGNVATDVLTVTLKDAVAPAITIARPTADGKHSTTAASVTLGGTASDEFGVTEVRWANDRGGSGLATGTTAWSAQLALVAGNNVITVTASDAAGNTSTDRISITSDGRAPAISVATPAANSVTKDDAVTVSGSASDDTGVTEVTWSNNRGPSGRASGTTSWSIASAELRAGVNVITVVATDAAGNRTSATVSVTRDSQEPAVAFGAPTRAATFITNKATLALGGRASDNAAVTQVTWKNSRGGGGTAAGTADWAVPAVALAAGQNVITVTARDAAGNVGTATLTVTLDTRAPIIAIQSPTSASSYATNDSALALAGVANDDAGVAEVTWSSSQGGAGDAAGTAAWAVRNIALKVGINTITVTARDVAGNTTSATLAVRVTDVKAPSVRIVAPATESSFSTAATVINLEGVAMDDFGVARVDWVSDRGARGVAKGGERWIAGGISLQPGVNVFTVTATDASGNKSSDVVRISYESGLPTISLTSPTTAATYTTSSSNVALTGVASDASGISRVKWSTDKGQVGDAVGTTAWSIPAITVALGTTNVTVTAYDNSGNASSVALSIVYADSSKPAVKIYTPTTASSVTTSTSSVTVAGTATDNVGVTQVTWTTDRGAAGSAFGTGSWSTPSLALAAGTTIVTVTARDAAGNVGQATISVTSTAKAPSSSSPSLSNGVSSTSLSVESTPTTSGYEATEPVAAPATSQPVVRQTSAPAPLSSSTSSTGTNAGAPSPQPATNGAPATPPVVRIQTPTAAARFNTTSASLSVAGVASHASGISVVRWMTDQGESGVADGTGKWTIPGIALKPGTTVITVTAAAEAGGDMTSAVLTVIRPEPLPKLKLTSPTADSQWTTGASTVALRGAATENVTRVLWTSDSGASGVAAGTTAWTIAGIRLQEGINRITLTAQDAKGRTDRQVLTITYRPRSSGASVGLE